MNFEIESIFISTEQRQKVEAYLDDCGKTAYPVLWSELKSLEKELSRALDLQKSLTAEEMSIENKKVKLRTLMRAIDDIDEEIKRDLTSYLLPTKLFREMFHESLKSINHQGLERSWPRSKMTQDPPKLGDRHLKDNWDLALDETLKSLKQSCQFMHRVLSRSAHGHYYKTSYPHVLTRGGIRTFIAAGFHGITTGPDSELRHWLDFLSEEVFGHENIIGGNPYRKWIYHVAGKTESERDAYEQKLVEHFEDYGFLIVRKSPEGGLSNTWGSRSEAEEIGIQIDHWLNEDG